MPQPDARLRNRPYVENRDCCDDAGVAGQGRLDGRRDLSACPQPSRCETSAAASTSSGDDLARAARRSSRKVGPGDAHRGDDVAVRVADRRGDGGQPDLELVDGDGVALLAHLGQLVAQLGLAW